MWTTKISQRITLEHQRNLLSLLHSLPLDRDLLWCLLRLLGFLLLISTNWRSKKGVVHRKVSFGLTTHSACLWAISGAKADHPWHFIVFFKNRIPSEFAQKLPSCSIEYYSTYLIPSFSYGFSFFWICLHFWTLKKNSPIKLRSFQNQPIKLREILCWPMKWEQRQF